MKIDDRAPLAGRTELFIAAPIEKVWRILTDLPRWPEWQPGITSIEAAGPLAVGTSFRWKGKGFAITSILGDFDPPRRIGWSGHAAGMKAIDIYMLEAKDGGTLAATEESMSGWLARLLKIFQPSFLAKSQAESLEKLKAEAER